MNILHNIIYNLLLNFPCRKFKEISEIFSNISIQLIDICETNNIHYTLK